MKIINFFVICFLEALDKAFFVVANIDVILTENGAMIDVVTLRNTQKCKLKFSFRVFERDQKITIQIPKNVLDMTYITSEFRDNVEKQCPAWRCVVSEV